MMLLAWIACAEAEPPPAAVAAPPLEPRTVGEAFPRPAGSARVDGGAFGAWLLDRPVHPADRPVKTHDGRTVPHEARVIAMDLVPGDLQQCADSAIRLRAEWLRAQGDDDAIVFHATSGDPIPWTRYRDGERPYERGNGLAWKAAGTGSWDGWLAAVFMWAGTRSLAYDTLAVDTPRPGDIVVAPGSPGHAVVLLDVATRGDETLVLVGEGFMPAQDFHVEIGPVDGWWRWSDEIEGFHWTLGADGLRRWK